VADLMRVHPTAFRRVGKPHAVVFSEELLDRVLKPIFITAPAGHGKTSFCKWNTLHDVERLAEKSSSISPIYVALHRLSTTTVETCEEAFFRSTEVKELVSRAQKNQKLVRLYLDGLDEVSTVEQQERLMLLARELSEKYLFVQVIVTGRDYLAGVGLRWLSRIHLAELTDVQVESLIGNWLDGDDNLRIEFQEQLAKTPTLRPLMRIPLLGTLVIAVFRRMRALPENKLKLYEAFTELMCGGWDLAKNVRRDTRFGPSTKLSVLTRLAGLLQIDGRRDAQVENLRAAIDQTARTFNEKWRELFDEILEDGLLVRTASNTFVFSHLSFQEYLAATELNDPQGNRSTQALKDFLRGDDRWREVIAFYLGIVKRPDETEAWMKKTAEQLAEKGADIASRYDFLLEQLAIAWPGWKPRRAA
jgi:predicted NACHT family NTPase